MSRVRLEFSKGREVRFLSHLDLVKAFERAIRRAEIPIAFSEGFNPHPKMNFASALAVGVVSDKEYVDIEIVGDMPVGEVLDRLTRVLPPGIVLRGGRVVPDSGPQLMAEVNRAEYQVMAEHDGSVDSVRLGDAIREFMKASEVVIMKRTKKGIQPRNIRPGIIEFRGMIKGDRVEFNIEVITGSEGNIRPEEAISAFVERSTLPIDRESLHIRRTGLYIEKGGQRINPMDA